MACTTCDDSCQKYHGIAQKLRKRQADEIAHLQQQGHWFMSAMDQGYTTLRRWTWEDPADFFDRMGMLCAKYLKDAPTYSPEAQKALSHVRPILAMGLEGDLRSNPQKSGDDLRMTWLRTHPAVYAEQGIFSLSFTEQLRIYASAGIDLVRSPTMAPSALGGGTVSAWNYYVDGKSAAGILPEPYRFATKALGFDTTTH